MDLLTFTGRATWTNLSRYSNYSERTMRRHAHKSVDFAPINAELLKDLYPKIIAIDATTIPKSGEHTHELGKFWSSCATTKAQFQHEHLFRDAKQHTGFGDCQSRDEKSLNFHANAALTAVNLARINAPTNQPFSMASVKRENLNRLIAQNIFKQLRIEPNLLKNPDFIRKILKIT